MTKKLLIYTAISMCFAFAPLSIAHAMDPEMDVTMQQSNDKIDVHNIVVTVNQSTLTVTGANGMVLEVVSLTGRPVTSIKIESPAQRVELNNIPKGCYILKIGKVVRKVTIR